MTEKPAIVSRYDRNYNDSKLTVEQRPLPPIDEMPGPAKTTTLPTIESSRDLDVAKSKHRRFQSDEEVERSLLALIEISETDEDE